METSLTNSTKTRMSEAWWGSLLSVMLDGANQQTWIKCLQDKIGHVGGQWLVYLQETVAW